MINAALFLIDLLDLALELFLIIPFLDCYFKRPSPIVEFECYIPLLLFFLKLFTETDLEGAKLTSLGISSPFLDVFLLSFLCFILKPVPLGN